MSHGGRVVDDDRLVGCFFVVIFLCVVLLAVGGAWFTAAMEARSYRKYCETPVTTWDALWLDLRVDECGP